LLSSTSWKAPYRSFVFINIVERLFSDIFSPFVFNNIVEHPFIFSPRVFPVRRRGNSPNLFNFIDMHFFKISIVIS